jgi:hypothetical protein
MLISVLSIASSSLFSLLSQIQNTHSNQGNPTQTNGVQSKRQQFQQEFQ